VITLWNQIAVPLVKALSVEKVVLSRIAESEGLWVTI
jgi:hypothetical protein